jgi:cobalamin biosynthesis Mg chelatase CobN
MTSEEKHDFIDRLYKGLDRLPEALRLQIKRMADDLPRPEPRESSLGFFDLGTIASAVNIATSLTSLGVGLHNVINPSTSTSETQQDNAQLQAALNLMAQKQRDAQTQQALDIAEQQATAPKPQSSASTSASMSTGMKLGIGAGILTVLGAAVFFLRKKKT